MSKKDTVRSGIDAYVVENGDLGYHRTNKLVLNGNSGANQQKQAFIWFKNPFKDVKGNVDVMEATFTFTVKGSWGAGPHRITAERVIEKWVDADVDWGTRPDIVATNSAFVDVSNGDDGDQFEITLTNMMQDVGSGGDWFGIRLKKDTVGDLSIYASESDEENTNPKLFIEWRRTTLPAADDLRPSASDSVTDPTPVLRWTWGDGWGEDDQQTHSKVEVYAGTVTQSDLDGGSPPSPLNGGTKESNEHRRWSLAGDLTLTDNTAYKWRVKVYDEAREAPWSELASFRYDTPGTLALTYPDVSPANEVDDITPPITWTFTGRTQEAYAIDVFESDEAGGFERVYHRPRKKSSALFHTLPKGVIRKAGREYKVVLKVWDTIARDAKYGFEKISRVFTYVRDGSPDPVDTLTVTGDGTPFVVSWSRTNPPDYFAIKVDDEIKEGRIVPADVLVSGDDYEMDFWEVPGDGVPHTVEVEAVVTVSGRLKHSDGNPTESVTHTAKGIHLVVPDKNIRVVMVGRRGVDLDIGELAETFFASGRRTPVRISDAIRGYEGRVQGYLITRGSVTADEYLRRLERIKGLNNRFTTRLITPFLNIPVLVEDISVGPDDDMIRGFEVSVDVVQTGDWTFKARD